MSNPKRKQYGFGAALKDLFQIDETDELDDVQIFSKADQWTMEAAVKMRDLTLHGRKITHVEPDLDVKFPRCLSLTLTNNYFRNWADIFRLIALFPNLQTLNLSGNHLGDFPDNLSPPKCETLKELILSACNIGTPTIHYVCRLFPNIKMLCIANNYLEYLPHLPSEEFPFLQTLDLSSNSFGEFAKLSPVGQSMSLNVSNCGMECIKSDETGMFRELEVLNIGGNPIRDWESINWLQQLPNLKNFRSSGLMAGERGCQAHEIMIAKLSHLAVLDGCTVTPKDRTEAELFFLSRLAVPPVPQVHQHDVERLLKIHGEPPSLHQKVAKNRDEQLEGFICYKNVQLRRMLQMNMEISKLVSQCSRILHYDWRKVRAEVQIDEDRYESISARSHQVIRSFEPKSGFRVRIVDDNDDQT